MEVAGWIKLYRKLLFNSIFRKDHTALIVFIYCLLSADYNSGKLYVGRFLLGKATGLKPTTAYHALLRLKDLKAVTLSVTGDKTEVSILNWDKYQSTSDTKVSLVSLGTTKEKTPLNNPVRENKELKKSFNIFDEKRQEAERTRANYESVKATRQELATKGIL